MDWSVQHGSGKLLIFTNETGGTVTDVQFRLRGAAVGGMFSQRDWSLKVPEMGPGKAMEAPFKAALGKESNPPRMEITWISPAGHSRSEVLSLPL